MLGLGVGLGESLLTVARLRLELGRNEGREFLLGTSPSRIGATEGIEVPLFGGAGVASIHARIGCRGGRWEVVDASGGLGGGTRVNGQPVSACLLRGGETIEIGPFRLRFLLNGAAAPLPGVYASVAAFVPEAPRTSDPLPTPVPSPAAVHRLVDPFGAVIDLAEGPTLLGRDPASAIRLGHDGLVSRRHARVVVARAGAVVEDLGSRHGTAVNGARIEAPTALRDGDTLRVGATTIAYRRRDG